MLEYRSYAKVVLVLSSYVPLYFVMSFQLRNDFKISILRYNNVPFVAIFVLIFSIAAWISLLYVIRDRGDSKTKILKIDSYKQKQSLATEYLIAYVFVFAVGLDFSRFLDSMIFILFIGIFLISNVRTDVLHINPLLAMHGYRFYEVNQEHRSVIVLSKGELEEKFENNPRKNKEARELLEDNEDSRRPTNETSELKKLRAVEIASETYLVVPKHG